MLLLIIFTFIYLLSYVTSFNDRFERITNQNGFSSETHNFTTLDGYKSYIFRIKGLKEKSVRKKPAVIFVNGLFADSNFWLVNKPHLCPPLVLAAQGFDVWLTNTRGNNFALEHTYLSPKEI